MWLAGGCEDRCVSVATQMEKDCLTASNSVPSRVRSHCSGKIWQQVEGVGETPVCTQACHRRYLEIVLFALPTVQETESITSDNSTTFLEE